MRNSAMILAVAAAMAAAAPAAAVPYKFVVTDPAVIQTGVPIDNNSYTFFFDSAPTPISSSSAMFSLTGSTYYSADVFGDYRADGGFNFYVQDEGGGLDTPLGVYFGDQLFSGDTTSPTFRLGTFLLDAGSITISEVGAAAAVPEPASWAMMIAGFALVGGVARLRKTKPRLA